MGKNGDDDSTDPREAQQMTGQSSWRTSRPSSATAPPTSRSHFDKTSPLSDMFKMTISSCLCECSNIFEKDACNVTVPGNMTEMMQCETDVKAFGGEDST